MHYATAATLQNHSSDKNKNDHRHMWHKDSKVKLNEFSV